MEHEHTPLVKSHHWSEFPPGTPLFESLVIFENYPSTPQGMPFLVTETYANVEINLIRELIAFEKTNLPLALAAQLEKNLSLILAFDHQHYTPETIAKLGAHLTTILHLIVDSPVGTRIDGIMGVPEEDTRKMMTWNQKAVTDRKGFGFAHKAFEAMAEEQPDAVALVFAVSLFFETPNR